MSEIFTLKAAADLIKKFGKPFYELILKLIAHPKIKELESEIKDFKNWEIKSKDYELFTTPARSIVYRLKEDVNQIFCAHCFDQNRIASRLNPEGNHKYKCHKCGASILVTTMNISKAAMDKLGIR